MSGKSTFERTVSVNIVLALAGAPVCAKAFEVSELGGNMVLGFNDFSQTNPLTSTDFEYAIEFFADNSFFFANNSVFSREKRNSF